MRTVLLSFWRSDVDRDLDARVTHLLTKTGVARWLWVVGDSTDDTEAVLRARAWPGRVTIVRHDTGIVGEDRLTRLRRFSQTADAGLAQIRAEDDRVLIHESDLLSPRDIAARLTGAWDEAVAGWPTLTIGTRTILYDTWAYRAQGRHFEGHPPYHPVYQPRRRFMVDAVGSVWSLPAWAIHDAGARCGPEGCVSLCAALQAHGIRILVDPTVPVVQPFARWTPAFLGLGESPAGTVSPFAVFSTWAKTPA